MYKKQLYFWISSENWKIKFKKTIPKNIKFLGENLAKDMTDIYIKTKHTLLREIPKNLYKWRDIPCSWVRRQYC